MLNNRKYRIGLDIGIGSVGWAVISLSDSGNRIESLGSRIFDSGESNEGKNRKSQERRGFRGVRRTLRRRYFRKERVKKYMRHIHFLSDKDIRVVEETPKPNLIEIRCRAVKEQISKVDLLRILIHTCNHRGYQDFYESNDEEINKARRSNEEKAAEEEERVIKGAALKFANNFENSKCQTVSEYILKNFTDKKDGRLYYRNRFYKGDDRIIILRKFVKKELKLILEMQQSFYPDLTDNRINYLMDIVFSQRDFEDGPGNPDDKYRRFTGFLDSIGYCRFYPDERRGFRNTLLGNLFSAINALSQYHYVNTETGEVGLTKDVADRMVNYILEKGGIKQKELNTVLKRMNVKVVSSSNKKDIDNTLSKSFDFIRPLKKIIDDEGMDWNEIIQAGDVFDYQKLSFLNQIGHTLSSFKTPRRREKEIEVLKQEADKRNIHCTEGFWKRILGLKMNGTSSASYHHMADAIEAFRNGDIYGNFQWETESKKQVENNDKRSLTLPSSLLTQDEDIKNNPVVYRSINETRKIVNALIRIYGAPECINVEVAKDLARSFIERREIQNQQKKNEKDNEDIRKKIKDILGYEEAKDVTWRQIEKYKLYTEQEGKCIYSGKELQLEEVLKDSSHKFEIDHIVPYSLILDNTLANKVLVYGSENQRKGQRTPKMYMDEEQWEHFRQRVIVFYQRKGKVKPISSKKYQYLMLESLYGEKAQELLSGWKSRNINDTRYITKYVVALLKNNLQFAGKPRVYGIRGSITSRFRKHWLNKGTWGSDIKCRENNLNHAADAAIIASLTPLDVEIAMDCEKLRQIYNHYEKRTDSKPYQNFLWMAVRRISGFYHKDKDEVEKLINDYINDLSRIPSVISDLRAEIDLRLGSPEGDLRIPEEFQKQVEEFYHGANDFLLKPYQPISSIKPERKFRGTITDSKPIRLIEENGVKYKISRNLIGEVTEKDLEKLYTSDTYLREALDNVFSANDGIKNVDEYMKNHNLHEFHTTSGQIVRKVSLKEQSVSNYYIKNIDRHNFSVLGMPKYYCIEIYKDKKGTIGIWGIRYVDVVNKAGKLYFKTALPADYDHHILYLQKGDYVELKTAKGKVITGFYQRVKSINRKQLIIKPVNSSEEVVQGITRNIDIRKYDVNVLGRKGGLIREERKRFPCFEPLLLRMEKN
ncbi:type II CRISPR RNA-guided endonuclease Cas9 [Allisonella histaminiformans]|uniref:type II CRISPR RNA-guided endonuclease Cas9 n=1 Tax=Allisonella histaminiformans TaxID=209880 RepID=UPI0022E41E0F|nr:type II CRISPR RNA-guided endonuclease Cas9 [Allisonella histaminiformans]